MLISLVAQFVQPPRHTSVRHTHTLISTTDNKIGYYT